MTAATCRPVTAPVPVLERELRPDRLGDLLECLADLLVETAEQRSAIERRAESPDGPTHDAVQRLMEVESALKRVGLEAATVHQLLQHEHLI
jgi:hypothetical protein